MRAQWYRAGEARNPEAQTNVPRSRLLFLPQDLSLCDDQDAWSFPFSPFFFFTCNPQFRGGWHTHEAGGCSFSADGVRGRGPNSRLCLARSYVWKKDNVVLTPSSSSRAVVEKDGSLLISQTWSGDIGDYTCEVLSEGGNDSRAARLEVM